MSVEDEATAVERAAANQRGHVENLQRLVSLRKRPQSDVEMAASWLPALEAAARRLRDLARAEKSATKQGSPY